VSSRHLESVEDVLVLIGRASQTARDAGEQLAAEGAEADLLAALEAADRKLTAAQAALMRSAYFGREAA
jgi:hypothetical protein